MVITDRLIFLMLEKTGCSHVGRLLERSVGGRSVNDKHDSLESNEDVRGRAVVGTIRDPWDWYVSLWGFGCDGEGEAYERAVAHTSFLRSLTDHRLDNLGFGPRLRHLEILYRELDRPIALWRDLYADSNDPSRFRRWLKLVFEPARRYDLQRDYGFSSVSRFAGQLTYLYLQRFTPTEARVPRLYGPFPIRSYRAMAAFDARHNLVDHFIRQERLADDLVRVLRHCGYDLSDAMEAEIRRAPPTNVSSRRRDLAGYYDRETIELVRQRERLVIDKHGYAPPRLT